MKPGDLVKHALDDTHPKHTFGVIVNVIDHVLTRKKRKRKVESYSLYEVLWSTGEIFEHYTSDLKVIQ